MKTESPLRVAHVVSGMVAGGIETWLMHVLRHVDQNRIQMDFFVNVEGLSHYDTEIRARGARVIRCRSPRNPLAFGRSLVAGLRDHGPYDVVHSHLDHYSGFVMGLAKCAGVPMRVAHSHSDTSRAQAAARGLRRIYLYSAKRAISRWATHGLANGATAGNSLFPAWGADERWRVHHCAVDLEAYRKSESPRRLRASLGLPPDGLLLCHVGGFREPKNHRFVLEIARSVFLQNREARLLLVGDGKLRAEIESYAHQLGIHERVIFAGVVSNVAEHLLACDGFLLPSLWEGLPLAAVEAQAAGLPCVIATTVTPAVAVVDDLVQLLPIAAPAQTWATTILEMTSGERLVTPEAAFASVERSVFNIGTAIAELEDFYFSGCERGDTGSG